MQKKLIDLVAKKNPDLNYSFIKDIILSLEEDRKGTLEKYKFN